MDIDEGNLQVISYRCSLDVILEKRPITIVILNLLVYNSSTIQYSNIAIVYDR